MFIKNKGDYYMDIKTINLEKELQELKYMEDSLYLTNVVPID